MFDGNKTSIPSLHVDTVSLVPDARKALTQCERYAVIIRPFTQTTRHD